MLNWQILYNEVEKAKWMRHLNSRIEIRNAKIESTIEFQIFHGIIEEIQETEKIIFCKEE